MNTEMTPSTGMEQPKSASRILSFEEFTAQHTETGAEEVETEPGEDQDLLPAPAEEPVDGDEPNLSINQMDAAHSEEEDEPGADVNIEGEEETGDEGEMHNQ